MLRGKTALATVQSLTGVRDERDGRKDEKFREPCSALAMPEHCYADLVELSSDWYWETDPRHRLSFVSRGMESALGLRPEDVLGKLRWEIGYIGIDQKQWDAHRAVLDAHLPFEDFRLALRSASGRTLHQSLTGAPRLDADGRFLGYRGIGHDITVQVEYEQALCGQRDLLKRVIETMAEGMTIVDAHGRFVLVNAEAERILGLPREKLIGLPCTEALGRREPYGDKTPQGNAFERQRRGESQIAGETFAMVRHDGSRVILSRNLARLEDAVGGFDGAIATYEDVTGHVQDQARLAKSEARFRTVFSMTPVAMAIHEEGVLTQVNPALVELFAARSEKSVVGSRLNDWVTPEYHDSMQQRLAKLAAEPMQMPYLERRIRRPDGSEVEVEMAGSSHFDDGRVRVHIVIRDISARKRHERDILRMNARLEERVAERTAELTEAYREIESFSYCVSHDLRTPLRAIHGFSRLLAENHGDSLAPEAKAMLKRVTAGAAYMGALIDGLLAFSLVSRQPISMARVDMAALVAGLLEELAPDMHGRGVELRITELPPCTGDEVLLRQVFANLLSNAFKYSARNPDAVIEVGALEFHRPVYFVRDNGAGFDMRHADKLFGMFQRLHSREEFEGMGIGLAMVQRIVERHGGRIWAESAPGKGTTFYFSLTGSAAGS